jgi:hypothetical protein
MHKSSAPAHRASSPKKVSTRNAMLDITAQRGISLSVPSTRHGLIHSAKLFPATARQPFKSPPPKGWRATQITAAATGFSAAWVSGTSWACARGAVSYEALNLS